MAEETTMIAKGKAKYLRKIKALGGAAKWYECGKRGGIRVALCLKALKVVIPEETWADEWEKKMA
ncbi:unnamed protein product [marine sediment metagenome]|uniref:Uncharacterized protein n=1 Tax=marine sediment metagenome TaxID=412755 RepID=X1L2E6_9ZZZZ